MHRLGHHRKALISYGTRFNSTVAEATAATSESTLPRKKRDGITLRWGTVEIPSREEVQNMPKAKLYSPDLRYLEKAPRASLAVRLVKPIFQPKDIASITEKRKAERLAREEKMAKLSTPGSAKTPTPEMDIAAITQNRMEKRQAREEKMAKSSTTVSAPEIDVAAITQSRMEQRQAREAKKAQELNETIRTVQDNADRLPSLDSLFDSPGPLPLARSAQYPSAKRSDHELSPSALKRREERRLRDNNQSRVHRSSVKRNRESSGSTQSNDMEFGTVNAESFDSAHPAALEAASPTVHAPEFNGPESIPETIDIFNNVIYRTHPPTGHGQHSVKVSELLDYRPNPHSIDSFVKGDYSKYTSLSSASNLTSPNALTAVKTAELALSYQRDYIIPQRKHAIEIVKTLVGGNFVQVAKERQETA
ncbi:hypothetical protein BYT27DRAFT_7211679 [Phlegmacium glaucopus]|nr:hypothetical protein BYT27DRAFT_7211679 [Phlegmacium glaucopus]